jgi:hypothetical protein
MNEYIIPTFSRGRFRPHHAMKLRRLQLLLFSSATFLTIAGAVPRPPFDSSIERSVDRRDTGKIPTIETMIPDFDSNHSEETVGANAGVFTTSEAADCIGRALFSVDVVCNSVHRGRVR